MCEEAWGPCEMEPRGELAIVGVLRGEHTLHNGEEGWKETLIVEWQSRGTRALKLETVVGRVKIIERSQAVALVEMEDIRRRLRAGIDVMRGLSGHQWDVDVVCDDKSQLIERVRALCGDEDKGELDDREVVKIFIEVEDEEDEADLVDVVRETVGDGGGGVVGGGNGVGACGGDGVGGGVVGGDGGDSDSGGVGGDSNGPATDVLGDRVQGLLCQDALRLDGKVTW